ncbi:MAG: hypothetical protein R3C32_00950 [Chloroflexota bacterium]
MRSRPSLRLGALLAAGALLASAPVVAQDPAGFPVTDAISGVSVTLPAPYETQEQAVPGTAITIRYYLAVDGETATSFSVFEVTEADGGYDLDGGVQGSADGTGGTLVSSVPIVHQGHEGRDFEVSVTDQASGVAGLVLSRLLWTGSDVVQLQAVGRDTERATVEALFAGLVATLDLGAQAIASPGASGLPLASDAPLPGASDGASAAPLVAPGG